MMELLLFPLSFFAGMLVAWMMDDGGGGTPLQLSINLI
jgi:hypothetical protein